MKKANNTETFVGKANRVHNGIYNYGKVVYVNSIEQFIEKANKIHNHKYNYDKC